MMGNRPAVRVAATVMVAVLLPGCSGASPEDSAEPAVPVATTAAAGETRPPATAEELAEAELAQLVRDYEAAENAVYLDPASDPSAALDPFLRNPAAAARVADILTFRNAGHTLESSTAEVHSVEVRSVELDGQVPSATLDECHTLSASGLDGSSGEPVSFSNRRLTTWTASQIDEHGGWRLTTYETGEAGSC